MPELANRTRWIVGGLLAATLIFFLWYLRSLVIYILISGILSVIAKPVMDKLQNIDLKGKSIPSGLAAFFVLILIFIVFFGTMSIIIPLFGAEIKVLSSIDYNLVWSRLSNQLNNLDDYLAAFGVLPTDTLSSSEMIKEKLQTMVSVSDLTSVFTVILGGLGNFGVAFFSISFITFFFLKEQGLFKRMVMVFVPKNYEDQFIRVFGTSKHLLARYFIGITIQITLISTLITIGLSLFGVKNAFVIGIFAGFINIIPYLGPFIGAIVGLIIALSTGLSLGYTTELLPLLLKVGGVFLTVQLLDNIIFQPIIFSNSVKAHPLEIFLVISVGGMMGGVAAMILAIPGYTVLRILAKEFLSEFKIVQDLTSRI
jgi:predicted PurR-regulated permease PerM